ncbi:5-methyltetrahydropteroyltriglutamate--homocysteine S-methyltransferase [Thermophilibacter immobilis]|uniref:5-methyltetrahydropteroyltriglutamate--homocysteine S-methyltransferase n=1 Tax=Thermophilibacter immobilis TaxID=2779519 RepID=A0A7S7M9A6_9ACTN|nr:5-methyltetrahydropteroyltriglutamate--homocysteine S-methyltransferase [Thermophilibacter immobilis]QOY61079.1 5-methyltetrahydropteroyltriglutamate--homocysteine S-methyltransferase [Thermophilibacter immobilis]
MSIPYDHQTPHRFDVVGSFLRSDALKRARADLEAGAIGHDQLVAIEDEAIRDLVAKEQAAGLAVITDGEFRRSYWHLDFMWGLQGIDHVELDHGYFFHGEETTHGSAQLTGKISGENHPFVKHFKFVQALEDKNTVAKQTIPAPAQTLCELFRDEEHARTTASIYPNIDDLVEDLGTAYRTVIAELYAAGCRHVQLDDCTWGMIVDKGYWKTRSANGATLEEEAERYLRVNNLALRDLPRDLTVNTHVCRGNYHSTYAGSGPYDRVAPFLFARENVHAFFLEFDDERSGGFAPLAEVPEDKLVVLGLVTTKSPVLENPEQVIARIHQAAEYVPLERLCLSPQCGFASCEIGNKLSEAEQWTKVRLVRQIAEEVWG